MTAVSELKRGSTFMFEREFWEVIGIESGKVICRSKDATVNGKPKQAEFEATINVDSWDPSEVMNQKAKELRDPMARFDRGRA